MDEIPALIPSLIGLLGLGFIPFLVVMGTSFTKIVVVLMLLRTALGVQTAPSSLVINSIALTLTAFILAPLGNQLIADIDAENLSLTSWDDMVGIYGVVSETFLDHLYKFSGSNEREFFMSAARDIWPPDMHQYIHDKNMLILLPSHVVTELTKAFQIAFLIFLPFVVIDMVISNILLAVGAMMMPPTLISLPLKLLLFVAADGWNKLLNSLILSYA